MRPSGPVPVSAARSISCSRARRRASGDALTRSPSCRSGGAATAATGVGSGSSGAGFSAGRLRLRLRIGHLLAGLTDVGDGRPDGNLTLGHRDLQEDAGRLCLDLLRHLLRVQLVERLALLDSVALGLQPLDDRARLHPLSEPGKLDLASHDRPYDGSRPVRPPRAARRTAPSPGRMAAARTSRPPAPPAHRASRRPAPGRRPSPRLRSPCG